jgi:aryl-alcohol dehydrogenase-like predicted oxidoreductase
MATEAGTWGYRDRFGDAYGRTYFRRFGPGVASSLGVGTYLGEPTPAVDDRHRDALVTALESGCNVVDTATNYRCGRAERVVGEALSAADVDRDAVVVASKAGFLPYDGSRPDDHAAYVRERFVDPGVVDPAELARGVHSLDPAFLDAMVDRSLSRLGLETVDCYYVHNPETQLADREADAVYDRLEAAFETLERRVRAGDVGAYGVATWEAFRVAPDHEARLHLPAVLSRARAAADAVGADDHSLSAIQLPFNVLMAEAFSRRLHDRGDERVSALEFARRAGLNAFTSASLAGGDLAAEGAIPAEIASRLSGDTPAQRALNFARSAPGVTCSLVGAGRPTHVREDLAAGTFDPMGARAFDDVFA